MAYFGVAYFVPIHHLDLKSKPCVKSVGFHNSSSKAERVIRQRPHHSKPSWAGTREDRVFEPCIRTETAQLKPLVPHTAHQGAPAGGYSHWLRNLISQGCQCLLLFCSLRDGPKGPPPGVHTPCSPHCTEVAPVTDGLRRVGCGIRF